MKNIFATVLALILSAQFSHAAIPEANMIYKIPVKTIDGKETSLEAYKGKVMLIVNTASKCGYTKQYTALEAIYEKYKDKGLVVLGFPSNDFLWQEPGTNAEIKKFCELKFKVTFPMFEKGKVKGDAQPLYQYLTAKDQTNPKDEISWNFEKFIVNRKGEIVGRFKSKFTPDSKEVTDAIEKALK